MTGKRKAMCSPAPSLVCLPDDLTLSLILPRLFARDLINLSQTNQWGYRLAHACPTHDGMPTIVRDQTQDLSTILRVRQTWPNLRLKFVFFDYQRSLMADDREIDEGFMRRLQVMGGVSHLVLRDPRYFTSFEFLAQDRLEWLDMGITPMTEEGARSLGAQLANVTKLTFFLLFNNRIEEVWWPHILRGLRANRSIKKIDFRECFFKRLGTRELADALRDNPTITHATLSNNMIVGQEAHSLANALRQNNTLTYLDLKENMLEAEGTKALCEGIAVNSTLVTLDLAYNGMGEAAGTSLANALRHNRSLTHLSLAENNLMSAGVRTLCTGLKENNNLQHLNLESNQIDDDGGNAIAEFLATNYSLITLNLAANHLQHSLVEICHSLQNNSTLKRVNLALNAIENQGLCALARLLCSPSCAIEELDLHGNPYDDEGASHVVGALASNPRVSILVVDVISGALEDKLSGLLNARRGRNA